MSDLKRTKEDLILELRELREKVNHLAEFTGSESSDASGIHHSKQKPDVSASVFESILKASPDVITITNLQGIIENVSSQALKLFGYETIDQIINRSLLDFIVSEDHEKARLAIEQMFAGNFPGAEEYNGLKADGSKVNIEVNGEFIKNNEGQPTGMVFITRDISERKSTLKKLQISEENYRSLFESNPQPMWIYDANTLEFLEVNAAALFNYGYSRKEFLKLSLRDIRPPEDVDALLKDVANTTNVFNQAGVWRHKTKKGEIIYVEISSYAMEFKGRNARLALASNITDRIKAEKSFIESEQRFRKIYENGPFGMILTNHQFRIIMANARFCEMVGYTEDELKELTFKEFSHPEDLRKDLPYVKKLITGKIPIYSTEKRYIHHDGHEFWGSLTLTANFDESGKFNYNVAIVEDISRRKAAEEEILRLNYRMSTATRASEVGIWEWEILNNKLIWDDQMYALYGISVENFSGAYETWVNGLHPDDREMSENETNLALSGLKEYDTEFRVIWPDGSVRYLKAKGEVLFDTNRKPVRMIGINYDITERKRIEDEILAGKVKLETAIESMTDAVIISDTKGQFLEFNDAFATFHRFSNKEECKKSFSEYPDLLELYFENGKPAPLEKWLVPRAMRGETGKNVIYSLRRKDTNEKWVGSYSFAPIRDKNGAIAGSVVVGRDITEQIQNNEKIRKSEERFRSTLDNMLEGCQIIGSDWRYIYLNRTAEIHNRRPNSELIGNRYMDMWPGIASTDIFSIIKRVLEKKKPAHLENRFIFPDGSSGWFDLSIQPVPEGVFILSIDITEPKKAEQALIESEEKYRLISDNAADWVYWMAPGGEIRYISPSCERVTGYSINDFRNNPSLLNEIVFAEDKELLREHATDVHGDLKNGSLEFRIVTKSGELRWISHNCSPMLSPSGQHLGTRGTNRDITERKLAELAVVRHSERLKILHNIDLSILSASESTDDLILKTLNQINEILGCNETSLASFEDNSDEAKVICVKQEKGKSVNVTRFIPAPEPGLKSFLISQKVLTVQDKTEEPPEYAVPDTILSENIISFITVSLISSDTLIGSLNLGWNTKNTFSDDQTEIASEVANQITIAIEQERLREKDKKYTINLELQVSKRTEQLEEANKELEAFSYSVSHDLRAPLRHINGYVDLLKNKYQESIPEKGQHYMNTIAAAALQMGTLIDDLLQFSRTGRQEMNRLNLEMMVTINEAIKMLATEMKNRNINWQIETLPEITADHSLLRQVWFNLLGNAIKFTRNKEVAEISVRFYEDKEEYVFSVKDNGAGFDMNYSHKLFGVFQRLHPASEFEGTGIGLANVRRIITKHGGRTWAESEPGKGATFYFSIPK